MRPRPESCSKDRLPKRIAVIASASGNGKSTLGRELGRRLGAPFVELDALVHGPDWQEATADELRAAIVPTLALPAWVIDGGYRGKIGDLVLERAHVVVWLDLPMRVWLPRLVLRTVRRVTGREELWNGNRETLRAATVGRDALIPYALRTHRDKRRRYPVELAAYPVVRLRTPGEVDAFLARFPIPTQGPFSGPNAGQTRGTDATPTAADDVRS
jgi:adenylate kinase family enzyme